MTDEKKVIPVHQWTHDGDEVLVVRFATKDGKSSSARLVKGQTVHAEPFRHPMAIGEKVTAPDWDPRPVCGGGIHAWPWAMSLGAGKDPEWDALWQVYGVKPDDIVPVENDGKIKFRTGILRFLGTWNGAIDFVLKGQMAWVFQASQGKGHATGDSSASSATGYRSASSATGDSSASSATGYRSASSATGYRSASSATGAASAAVVVGLQGRAKAGEFGCIALAWWNADKSRSEMRCALTGKGQQLKAN
ncbi:MAG: hypothetical protein ACLQLH_02560, partial [Terracidiphilus sp.]